MKKLLVAVVFFCADAGALLSGDTLQGIASVINATKGNNNYQQQGYQNGTQQWGFFSPQAQKNTQVSLNQVQSQTATIFIQQGWSVEQNAILKNGSQILGYITNEGWVISPEGQVVYGPNDERRFQKFAVPKKIKNAFKKLGYVYQNTNQNNQQKGFVMASGGQQWIASQPVLNNGQPASSDPQALPRFLKIIGEMADDTMAILETNVANEKVRNLVYKLLKLMMQSCTQQSADRSKLMKMRDSILELAKKADATSVAEKFDTIVKSTFKDNDLLVSEDVEEREAERTKKLKKRKQEEKQRNSKKGRRTDYEEEGYDETDFDDYYED